MQNALYSRPVFGRLMISLVLLLLMATTLSAKQHEFVEKRVFAVEDGASLEINYFGGNVEVSSHDVDRIVIRIIKRIEAVSMDEARLLADNIIVKARQTRSALVINTNFLKKIKRSSSLWGSLFGSSRSDPYGSVDFIILVPPKCDLTINNNSGNISLRDLTGEIKVASSAADITLNAINGPISINNAGGATKGEMLFGDISIEQPMGSIDLNWIEGDIRIRSNSAKINLVQERGALDLTTKTGEVIIQSYLYTGRDSFITTTSGDIKLLLPQSLSGTLEISSELGNIETRMPLTLENISKERLIGHLGSGGVRIKLSSGSGDVLVAEF